MSTPFHNVKASDAVLRRLMRELVSGSRRTASLDHGANDALRRLCGNELERRKIEEAHLTKSKEVQRLWDQVGDMLRALLGG